MAFDSILYDRPVPEADIDAREEPACFHDLHLDQIVASITAGREAYRLQPFFYDPLTDVSTITYRHEVMRDLEDKDLLEHVRAFARRMRAMREHLAQADKLHHPLQRQRWFQEVVRIYCTAVIELRDALARSGLQSRGLLGLRDHLERHTASSAFVTLFDETRSLTQALSQVTYRLYLQGSRIWVDRYGSEPDYSADVAATFEKFKQGEPRDYAFKFSTWAEVNSVEGAILDRVALLFPAVFESLTGYCDRHRDYLDDTIRRFDREVHFYIACLEHVARLRQAGLSFCYPDVSATSREILGRDVFDLALADKLAGEQRPVVTNDFYLAEPERIIVVSGPNQGGKTTFARTFGQLHYLASLGCLVPGREARLFLFDHLFAHFEREEDLQNLSGKLEDDLIRIRSILEAATSESVLIMNESFSSTTLQDALFINKEIFGRIIDCGMLCVAVTFLDELASLGPTTVSMVSMVAPDDPAVRTFKVVRKPADGLAYAAAIAQQHRLSYDDVKRRIAA